MNRHKMYQIALLSNLQKHTVKWKSMNANPGPVKITVLVSMS